MFGLLTFLTGLLICLFGKYVLTEEIVLALPFLTSLFLFLVLLIGMFSLCAGPVIMLVGKFQLLREIWPKK